MFYNLLLIPLNLLNNLLWKHSFSRILGDTFSFSPIQDKYYIDGFSILLLMMLIHFPQPYVIFAWIQWLVSVVPLLWSGIQGLASTWIFESWLCFLSFSVFLAALNIWSFSCLLAPLPGSGLKRKENANSCLLNCGPAARFLPPSHVLLGQFLVLAVR